MESLPALDKRSPRTSEIEHALRRAETDSPRISSKKGLKNHIISLAQHYGFDIFLTPIFGYKELTVRTRLKHARRYGKTPTTKILVISLGFVRNIYRIYRRWPALGEFFIQTALLHESRHLKQDIDTNPDQKKREHEANTFMIEKTGRPGLIVSVWYAALHRETGTYSRLFHRAATPDKDEILKLVINCMEMIYRDLIPPELYDKVAEDVFWLEDEYRHHRKR